MTPLRFSSPAHVWRTGEFPDPWDEGRVAIHDHLLAARARDGVGDDLPDDATIRGEGRIEFVAGLADELGGGRGGPGAAALVEAIHRVLARPDPRAVGRFYALARSGPVLGALEETTARLRADASVEPARLEALALWLARRAPDREPVKLALVLLGLAPGDRHRDLMLLFGTHDEFTRVAAAALRSALPADEAEAALRALAREVRGWGRIDLVRRLAPTADEAFRRWLVREGYRNAILDEHLAHLAAVAGDLLGQLRAEGAAEDRALLDGAAGLFDALVHGGPDEEMRDYPEGAAAAITWLGLLGDRTLTLAHAAAAAALLSHVEDRREGGEEASIWTDAEAAEVERLALARLRGRVARAMIEAALEGRERGPYQLARRAAPAAGIDPWPHAFDRQLRGRDGDEPGPWYALMRTDDPGRAQRVVALALERLPLEAIATGPADELGLGRAWRAHSALGFVVQDLRRFPGRGWPLVAAALRSPVVSNRNMAIRALSAGGKGAWPPEALPAIRRAIDEEPREDVRRRLIELLRPEGAG